jgi:hypothetical protein
MKGVRIIGMTEVKSSRFLKERTQTCPGPLIASLCPSDKPKFLNIAYRRLLCFPGSA